ncbi:UNVERIFIED_CONTAM: hypothetical protein K2H54_041689 [Gekko kuhli]
MVKNEGDCVALELDRSYQLNLCEVSHAIIEHPFPEMRIGVGGLLIPWKDLLVPMNTAMDGCLRRWNWLNTSATWLEGAALDGEGTKACFPSIQRGSFFPGGGLATFLLSGLPTRLSHDNESLSLKNESLSLKNESVLLSNESWSLAVEVSLRAGPQKGTILAVSPPEQAPILSLRLEDTDLVAQLGEKVVLKTPLPGAGCLASGLLLRVTPAELALHLGTRESSALIPEADFKTLRHLWLSGEGHLFVGGLPGQGDPPPTPEGRFFRGCLHEIRVQGLTLDLDSSHYRSHAIWAHSCPRNESLELTGAGGDAKPGSEGAATTTPAASPLPS